MTAFPEYGFEILGEILNKKEFRLYIIFGKILYHERLRIFIVNKENQIRGSQCKQNFRLAEDCRRSFKLKAINHKITSCQTYIRHSVQFSYFISRDSNMTT